MNKMKIWYAGCFAFSLALAMSGIAFAEGSGSEHQAPCANSALVCKSLDSLHADEDQTVAHSCTTLSGKAGAWVCPADENLAEDASVQRSPSAEAQDYREIDAQ